MPKQFINAHTRLREPTLLEKLSDLAAKLKKKPAPIPTPRRHPFYEDTKHCEIPFASPPSSLPPRTLQQTAALLALLPSLQTAFEANNERVYSKLLRNLFKLDPEVCVDFELAVLTAKEADLGDAYFRFVRKGLDERSVWQGQGVFSWLGFCSYTIIETLKMLIQTGEGSQHLPPNRFRWDYLETMIEDSLEHIARIDKMTAVLLARIWGEISSFEQKKRGTLRLIAHWKFALQEHHSSLEEVTPLSPSTSISSTSTSQSKASSSSSLFASLPFLPFHKPSTLNSSSSDPTKSMHTSRSLPWVVDTSDEPSINTWAIERCKFASGDVESECVEKKKEKQWPFTRTEEWVIEYGYEIDMEGLGIVMDGGEEMDSCSLDPRDYII